MAEAIYGNMDNAQVPMQKPPGALITWGSILIFFIIFTALFSLYKITIPYYANYSIVVMSVDKENGRFNLLTQPNIDSTMNGDAILELFVERSGLPVVPCHFDSIVQSTDFTSSISVLLPDRVDKVAYTNNFNTGMSGVLKIKKGERSIMNTIITSLRN